MANEKKTTQPKKNNIKDKSLADTEKAFEEQLAKVQALLKETEEKAPAKKAEQKKETSKQEELQEEPKPEEKKAETFADIKPSEEPLEVVEILLESKEDSKLEEKETEEELPKKKLPMRPLSSDKKVDKTEDIKDAKEAEEKPKKKLSTKKKIILCVILALLIIVIITAIQAIGIKNTAEDLKVELGSLITGIKEEDYDATEKAFNQSGKDVSKLKKTLNQPQWKLISLLPTVGDDIKAARVLTGLLSETYDEVLSPSLTTFRDYPFSKLQTENGISAKGLSSYLDMAISAQPILEKYDVSGLKFNLIKSGNTYLEKLQSANSTLGTYGDYLKVLKGFLGNGEDKLFLIVAQNSAEIRASGGFPGSIGTLEIKNGYIKVGDFKGTNEVLLRDNTKEGQSTEEEFNLFSYWVQYPRDLCYNPNFERIAYQWSKSYIGDETIDGVISLTPTIIGQLLDITGPITLSNNVKLDSTNATKYIQRDIYFEYFTKNGNAYYGNDMTDDLFAETARLTLDKVFEDISLDKLLSFINIFEQGVEERVVELWSSDEETEQLLKDLGCSGGIAYEDATGIYFSCNIASKLGWFFGLETDLSTPTINSDGTKTYTVTATLSNKMTSAEIAKAGAYIIGDGEGSIKGYLHIFAPDGGTISDVSGTGLYNIKEGEYEGHQCFYTHGVTIAPGKSVSVTYKVTVDKDIEGFRVIHTPTIGETN